MKTPAIIAFPKGHKVASGYLLWIALLFGCIALEEGDGFSLALLYLSTLPFSLLGWLQVAVLPVLWLPKAGALVVLAIAALLNLWILSWLTKKLKKPEPLHRNTGSYPSSGDSPASETPSSLGPGG